MAVVFLYNRLEENMNKQEIVYLPVGKLKPYKNNPRKIPAQAVDAVCQAIKDVDFRRPLDVLPDGTIINGHTRWKAAKKMGLKEVPCIICTDLNEEKIRKWRLEDNKAGEYSGWDADKLAAEIKDLDFGNADFFAFDFESDTEKKERWKTSKALCDLKDRTALHKAGDMYYQSLMKVGKSGQPLAEIKNKGNIYMFADGALEYLKNLLGDNFSKGDWCLMTTPRRRHTGFHFATAICEIMAEDLQIPFYKDAVTCLNHNRISPVFEMKIWPKEKNVILYDDILTTGCTMKATRELLTEAGYTVMNLISIDNH